MKCPSSSASAARNSARISSSVIIVRQAPLGRGAGALQLPVRRNRRLRLRKAAPIEPRKSGARTCVPSPTHANRGCDETDWMGDRLGRGRAHTGGRTSACKRAQPTTTAAGAPPRRPRPRRPPPAPIVYGSVGHMIPTPGIGMPDGRKGLQDQVTPIGQRGARLPQQLPADAVRADQRLRAGAAAVGHVPLSPRRQPDAVAQFAQHADRGGVDAGPGADPGRRSRCRRSACCATNTPRRRPT